MAQQILSTNTFTTAKWIVSATSSDGTHTTIAAALTSASSGDTIFIRPGTYTENLTLKVGVNLTAFVCDAFTPNVTIVGTCTLTTAGTVSISGIRLQTNSAALLAVTGSAASIVNLTECFLNCSNNTGITFSSSSGSSQINITNCNSNLGTTGIGLFAHSASGSMVISGLQGLNTGASLTASTCSAGVLDIKNSQINFPITYSLTGTGAQDRSSFDNAATNTTCMTQTGTGTIGAFCCRYFSGTASAISIGSGCTFNAVDLSISSTNTNAITGAGTLNYAGLTFVSTSSTVNVTTQVPFAFGVNVPGFLAIKSATTNNVTGTATVYTAICDTEVYDTLSNYNNATGVFTAPVKGKYLFVWKVYVTGCTIASSCTLGVVTTARTYNKQDFRAAGTPDFGTQISCIADMSAADTASFTVSCFGEAGDTDDLLGNGSLAGTWVEGRFLGAN